MFLTQVWGTVLGAFINYVVMISIVNTHRDLLTGTNGNYAWSGQLFQSLQTQATTWALARELYTKGGEYVLIPIGLGIGAALVVIHYVFALVSKPLFCLPRLSKSPVYPAHPLLLRGRPQHTNSPSLVWMARLQPDPILRRGIHHSGRVFLPILPP